MEPKTKKIKLAVAISDLRIGGAQKLLVEILDNIEHQKFDVHLFVCVPAGDQKTFFSQLSNRVSVHQLSFGNLRDFKSYRILNRELKELNPDIVWSHLFFANTVFRLLKPLHRYKVISVEHNTYVNKSFICKLADHLLSYITYRIVAVSNHVADFTAQQEVISRRKFTVILNGIDVRPFQKQLSMSDRKETMEELGLSVNEKIILNIGQLIHQKNQKLLIEAFANFSQEHDEYRLLILGEGAKRSELEETIVKHNLDKKVFLPGIKKDVAHFFKAADFFVLSSRFEGFPLVIAEALASGLPIISTPVSGSDFYVDEDRNGFLVSDETSSVSSALHKMASLSQSERDSFRRRSEELSQHLDIAKITASYEKLFLSASG